MMRFVVLLIACLLDGNRMPHVESRMRNATNSDDCPHNASVCFSRLPWDGINLLGNTIRLWLTNVAKLGSAAIEGIFIHKFTNNWRPYQKALRLLLKIPKNYPRQYCLERKLFQIYIFWRNLISICNRNNL